MSDIFKLKLIRSILIIISVAFGMTNILFIYLCFIGVGSAFMTHRLQIKRLKPLRANEVSELGLVKATDFSKAAVTSEAPKSEKELGAILNGICNNIDQDFKTFRKDLKLLKWWEGGIIAVIGALINHFVEKGFKV